MNTKKRLRRLLRRKRFYILAVIIIFLIYAYSILDFRLEDRAFIQRLESNPFGYQARVSYLEEGLRKIRYIEIGHDSLPLITFIHGAPSSSAFWIDLLKDSLLLSKAKLMAVDRPGYGYSNFGKTLTSVREQARLIAKVIRTKRLEHESIILHGSSYGGTVAARIAMDFPNLVDGLLLQSASVAPGQEKTYPISYPVSAWPLKWLIPTSLRVANSEKLSHRLQLEEMEPLWHRIRSAVIIMHGGSDKLIYPHNAYFALQKLVNAACLDLHYFQERGHDLLWNKQQELKEALVNLTWFTTNHKAGQRFNMSFASSED